MSTAFSELKSKDLYSPELAEITAIRQFTDKEKWFDLKLLSGKSLGHQPGQFVQVSLFGAGIAPISVTSSPTNKNSFELCVREVGMLTKLIHKLEVGSTIGIGGPYGKGFDVEAFKGKDILIIGGGIGIVPLRSLINYVIDDRKEYGRLIILYGAKSPDELLYADELNMWEASKDIEFHVTVDKGTPDWKGNTGVITTLIPPLDLDLKNTVTAVVGPPVMYKFVLMTLKTKRILDENIYVSFERRMKCGVGKCGHCQINHTYVCQDGPVYHYPDVKNLQEAV